MALTLEIISRQRAALGERARCIFDRHGGNLGRSLECDWILPDSDRFVSSRHAAIDFRSGSYHLIDLSTNGVYVNDSDTPVGRGRTQRLFAGDRLRMGEYLIVAQIAENSDLTAALLEDAPDPVNQAQKVDMAADHDPELIEEHLLTGAFDDLHLEKTYSGGSLPESFKPGSTQPVGTKNPSQRKRVQLSVVDGGAAGSARQPRTSAETAARKQDSGKAGRKSAGGQSPAELVEVFLRAAGLDAQNTPQMDARTLMHTLGQLLRETVAGVTDTLHDRARHKHELKLGNTTIQPRNNNPLKFSASMQETMTRLLTDSSPEYMAPVPAMRDAFRDIKEHQGATMTAMQQAFIDFIERLDPTELEQRFESAGRRKALLPGSAKARNWEQYAELYEVLTRHAPGQLPQLFGEEFARAYADALEALQAARRQRA